MAKSSSVFVCQSCGYESAKWVGQCPSCGAWNSFVETAVVNTGKSARRSASPHLQSSFVTVKQLENTPFMQRIHTGIGEFDRVLGGGIVLGSVVLIGGEPGIGKSTLLTQVVLKLLKDQKEKKSIIYVCAEESPEQIHVRIKRLMGEEAFSTKDNAELDNLLFFTSTNTDEVVAAIEQEKPMLVIVDSIQSMRTDDLTGAAGSVGQLKESTLRITEAAKRSRVPTFLVGHVTKEGVIAGPKVLEHIVDTVIEISGERSGYLRILHSAKNRFGPTDESGVFRVAEFGLEEVTNPSMFFLEESTKGKAGSAIVPIIEGSRVLLIELQALVVPSQIAVPRRIARGISVPRLQVVTAVLQKYGRLPLGTMDIFVNAVGGMNITEPSADLALALAIASSTKNVPLPTDTVYAGEIGLLGEVRTVTQLEKRSKEAQRMGYERLVSGKQVRFVTELMKMLKA